MDFDIPIRKVETYRAEDGRTIEHQLLYKKLKTFINTDEDLKFNEKEETFIGVSPIPDLPLKFNIEANNLEEAFDNYIDIWNGIMAELEKKIDPTILDPTMHDGIITPEDIDFSDFTDGGIIV